MIGDYYDEKEITPLIQLMSLTFFITSIGNQYRILNQKYLRFNRLARVEMCAALLSFIVAIYCAMNGFGVYSLVYATLVNQAISNLIFLLQGIREHKPELIYKHSEIF